METKNERVRCGTESRYIKEFENFGWTFSSKQLLNKFGNPLPLNHGLTNEEIMAKCFYELVFIRDVDINLTRKLSELEAKYNSLSCNTPSRFTKGRIFAMIVCSIFATGGLGIIFAKTPDFNNSYFILSLVIGFLGLGGLIALILTGINQVKKTNSTKAEFEKERNKILNEANSLLKQSNQSN